MLKIKTTTTFEIEEMEDPKYRIGDVVKLQNVFKTNLKGLSNLNSIDPTILFIWLKKFKEENMIFEIVDCFYDKSKKSWAYKLSIDECFCILINNDGLYVYEKNITKRNVTIREKWDLDEQKKTDGYYDLLINGECCVSLFTESECDWFIEYLNQREFFSSLDRKAKANSLLKYWYHNKDTNALICSLTHDGRIHNFKTGNIYKLSDLIKCSTR